MVIKKFFSSSKVKAILTLLGAGLFFYITSAFAETGESIGTVASNVTSTMTNVGQLLGAGAYVAGFGLTIISLFKFKQHHENPQQHTLGAPIGILAIGVALIFLPSVVTTGGQTIWSGSQSYGGFSGKGLPSG